MPPHTIADWVGIVTIVSISFGAIFGIGKWLSNYANQLMIEPLRKDLTQVSKSVDDLTKSSKTDHEKFDVRLDKHDRKIERHDAEIGFLYDLNHLERGKKHED